LLLPYGLAVDCVRSGQEAIDKIRKEQIPYDIVFMDHMMPEMDGIKATGIIRAMGTEHSLKLPIIALTANAIVGMREMFLEQGFNDYLSKPISRSRLDEILVKWTPQEKQQAVKPPKQDTTEIPFLLEGVDINKGLTMVSGSRVKYFEVLIIFSQDAAGRLDVLRKIQRSFPQSVVTEEEISSFVTQVHALKSAAASIGATGLSEKAAALEAAGRREELEPPTGRLLEEFCGALEELIKEIRNALHLDEEEKGEIPEEVREVLGQLRKALEAEEIRPIDTELNRLGEMELSPPLRQAAASIANSVLLSDLPRAIALIDGLFKS
jgi:CheY-like chemotaxis protein